ncbi:MAG: hypothetical protein ACYS8X_13075 [Planctomycetota bacterium]|jgi:hypothetical protein
MSVSQLQESKPSRLARARRVLSHVPVWVIALLFALAAKGVDFLDLALGWDYSGVLDVVSDVVFCGFILAGAIQRLNWRHALVLMGLFALGVGGAWLVGTIAYVTFPHGSLLVYGLLVWLLGIGEMLTAHRRSWMTVVYLLFVGIAVAAIEQIAVCMIGDGQWRISTTMGPWSNATHTLEGLTYGPVRVLLVWWGLSAAFAVMRRGRRAIVTGGCVLAVIMVFHWLFWAHLVFAFARMSVAGRGPFSRNMGILWVKEEGRPEDMKLILQEAQQADWEPPWRDMHGYADWRNTAADLLLSEANITEESSRVFVEMLRRKRTPVLARYTARQLGNVGQAEIAPVLLRYALGMPGTETSEVCSMALVQLGVREAGICILRDAIAYDRPESKPEDFPISTERQWCLTSLLRKDVGESYVAWRDAWVHAVDEEPSSLPEDVQDEISRELACYNAYNAVRAEWREARGAVIRKRLAAQGKMGQFKKVMAYIEEKGDAFIPDWEVPTKVRTAGGEFLAVVQAVTKDMTVPEPDYDAPTIEAFEKEIDDYIERVYAVIDKYLPPDS